MSELTPTRSTVIALVEERRAMRDAYAFLDEKCLLLAQAMMKELRSHDRIAAELRAALARHGLAGAAPAIRASRIMGVLLREAEFAAEGTPGYEPVNSSPEAEAARLAAVTGNLERLRREYRRAVRRVWALQDVLLPEVDRSIYEIETHLEELEQDEAVWLRHRRRGAP